MQLVLDQKTFEMVPNYRTIKAVQKATGKDIVQWLNSLKTDGLPPFDDMVKITQACITPEEGSKVSLEEVGDALLLAGLEEFNQVIMFLSVAIAGRKTRSDVTEALAEAREKAQEKAREKIRAALAGEEPAEEGEGEDSGNP